jgi:hypothetical protein
VKIRAEQRTDLWSSDVEWPEYETYVFGSLQRLNPGAVVRHNVRVSGTLSGRSRQIDVLVERNRADFNLKIAVDCKCYKRKVNVKDVEAFLGMLEDIGIRKGVLVTNKGYSKSAYHRARYGSRHIELRILAPERLSEFQHMGDAFPWVEPLAAVVSTPEGWVADKQDTRSDRMQFSMYPLGHTRDSAMRYGAFLYGNIILKREEQPTMEAIAALHEKGVLKECPAARFERLPPFLHRSRSNGEPVETLFRVGHIHEMYKGPEYSLYIDHPKGVLVLVLLCPEGEEKKYLPILKWVGEKTLMMDCVDQRPMRTHEVRGRISVYWNRARYVEVYEREDTKKPWRKVREYIEILEPLRLLPQSPNPVPEKLLFESCEFATLIMPTDGAIRREIPGEGWTVPLWDPAQSVPKPRIILRFKDVEELAEIVDPQSLSFFTSSRLHTSSDEWPAVPSVDFAA